MEAQVHRNRGFSVVATVLSLLILFAACGRHKEKQTLSPSEASGQIFDSVLTLVRKGEITTEGQFNGMRDKLAAGLIGDVKSDSLQGEALLEYGKLLVWSGNEAKGREVLESVRQGKDKFAPEAWKELISLEIEGNNYAKAEDMMKEYRAAFPPDTSDLQYLYSQTSSLSDRFSEASKPEDAIRVCMEELNALPTDAPYSSFFLAMSLSSLMMEVGRTDELRALLDEKAAQMQTALDLRWKNAPADSAARANDPIGEGLKGFIEALTSFSSQLGLIGKKAPGFTFLHVYNADSTLTLEKLQGKVVMLDFWATWCLPCIVGFAEAHRIYDDYKTKGFEILGITSLQGEYHDRDAGISEGTKEKPLGKAREIELTGQFIKKHNIVWPCGISDRSVIDPSYKIGPIPTFVLVDRSGVVRFIQAGVGQEQQKRRVIEKLIESS
jgi:thiol-disulfide isomerase/thioredoxin